MIKNSLLVNKKNIDDFQPFRKVMIKINFCYICNQQKESYDLDLDNYDGFYGKLGWIYCKDCENIVNYVEKQYYKEMNHLTYTQCKYLIDKEIIFWRVSSNREIKPYLQKACIRRHIDNIISYFKKRVWIPVEWEENNGYLAKKITLANAIYHNENIFGKNIKEINITNLNSKWKYRIKKEYHIYRKKKYIFNFINRIFSNDISNYIFSFINNFL